MTEAESSREEAIYETKTPAKPAPNSQQQGVGWRARLWRIEPLKVPRRSAKWAARSSPSAAAKPWRGECDEGGRVPS